MKQDFKKIYTDWLYENIEEYKVNDSVYCLTLPFLDHNNDCIEIFIKILENGKYRITDDAETIDELGFSQFDVFASRVIMILPLENQEMLRRESLKLSTILILRKLKILFFHGQIL